MSDLADPDLNAGMRDSRRRALGYTCYLAGLILAIVGGAALLELFGRGDFVLHLGLLLVTALLAITLLAMAEGFLVPSVREVCAADPRPPVLYLRPFGEDRELTYDVISSGETTTTITAKAEDFLLALNAVGPLVSIAEPGLKARLGMHPHGAFRDYVGGGDWQARVVQLLDRAGMVVLAIGDSPGIEWEIAQVRERVGPESLLLYLPPRPAGAFTRRGREAKERAVYERFRPLLERHFGLPMPEFSAATYIIGFDAGGEPVLAADVPPRRWVFTEHARVAGAISDQLRAVLARVRPTLDLDHYRVPGRTTMYARLGVATLPALAAFVLVGLGAGGSGTASGDTGLFLQLALGTLPGLALLAGWTLLARHFRRRWVWLIPLLLGATLVMNTAFNAAIVLGLWDGDLHTLQAWRAILDYTLNAGYALAVLALGLGLRRSPPAEGVRAGRVSR